MISCFFFKKKFEYTVNNRAQRHLMYFFGLKSDAWEKTKYKLNEDTTGKKTKYIKTPPG